MNHTSDIICALSTPPGLGALAIIRLSGKGCFGIIDHVFSKNISNENSNTATHGWIHSGGEKVDEVVITIFRSPKSFTGEDVVEISCHGSVFIQQKILQMLIAGGARIAAPGEFTMRAFLNGKMDLSQAEAVADLIASESAASHRLALHQMRGGFSSEIKNLREKLVHFASLIELELDFAEEDVQFANRPELNSLLLEVAQKIDALKNSFAWGNAMKNGVPVAIIGPPNSGKSTLLNTLLNEERAIVSDIPGTTRDTIEDQITLAGIRFRFIDTAGIRSTEDRVETLGIERSMRKAREAAVLLLLFDVNETGRNEVEELYQQLRQEVEINTMIILVGNKTDDPRFIPEKFDTKSNTTDKAVLISAKQKTGIQELHAELLAAVEAGRINEAETVVTNARHFAALTKSSTALSDVLNGLANNTTSDLLAVDLRRALFHLGEIIGEVTADDLLNNIFSKFCIGK